MYCRSLLGITIFAVAHSVAASESVKEMVGQLASNTAAAVASGSDLDASVKDNLASQLDDYIQSKASEIAPSLEVSVTGISRGEPTLGILGVIPIYESEDFQNTVFTQGSLFNQDGRQTFNIGVGYRYMTPDEHWLFGLNGFYDHEFPYDHSRSSLGAELRSSVIELNANSYHAISDWRAGKNGLDEKALDGHDLEIGFTLPYMPGGKLYHKEFTWAGERGSKDLKGGITSLELSGDLLITGLTLELGVTDYQDRQSTDFIKLSYVYKFGREQSASPFFSDHAYQFTSMKDKRLDKVRRENQIVKQTSGRITVNFR